MDFTITPYGDSSLRVSAETPEGLQIIIYARGCRPRAKSCPEVHISSNPYSKEINNAVREAVTVYLAKNLGLTR